MRDFEYAKDKILMGRERRSLILSDQEKRITAYHEAGHALSARKLPGSDPVHKVSIIPRGQALGITMQLPEEDRHGYSKDFLLNNLVMLLGGRVAEELIFEDVTTGASNDIERATSTARRMVCEWGMSDAIGTIAIGESGQEVFIGREWVQNKNYSEDTARLVDKEVRRILDEAHERCRRLLTENIDALHRIAEALITRESIDGTELDLLIEGKPLPPLDDNAGRGGTRPSSGADAAASDASSAPAAQQTEAMESPQQPAPAPSQENAPTADAGSSEGTTDAAMDEFTFEPEQPSSNAADAQTPDRPAGRVPRSAALNPGATDERRQ